MKQLALDYTTAKQEQTVESKEAQAQGAAGSCAQLHSFIQQFGPPYGLPLLLMPPLLQWLVVFLYAPGSSDTCMQGPHNCKFMHDIHARS
eukprot:6459784-Amphidinium_carterae.3